MNNVGTDKQVDAQLGVEEQVEVLEGANRDSIEEEGEGGTAQGGGDVELPGAVSVQLQNVAQHHLEFHVTLLSKEHLSHLYRLKMFIRVNVAGIRRDYGEDNSEKDEEPVDVPNLQQ